MRYPSFCMARALPQSWPSLPRWCSCRATKAASEKTHSAKADMNDLQLVMFAVQNSMPLPVVDWLSGPSPGNPKVGSKLPLTCRRRPRRTVKHEERPAYGGGCDDGGCDNGQKLSLLAELACKCGRLGKKHEVVTRRQCYNLRAVPEWGPNSDCQQRL